MDSTFWLVSVVTALLQYLWQTSKISCHSAFEISAGLRKRKKKNLKTIPSVLSLQYLSDGARHLQYSINTKPACSSAACQAQQLGINEPLPASKLDISRRLAFSDLKSENFFFWCRNYDLNSFKTVIPQNKNFSSQNLNVLGSSDPARWAW